MTQNKPTPEEHGPEPPIPAPDTAGAAQAATASQIALEIMDAIRTPLLVLESGMRVQAANHSFCRLFRTSRADAEQLCFHDLDSGQWDIPTLRLRLEDILAHGTSFEDFEVELDFPRVGRKTVLLDARRLRRGADATPLLLLAFEDVSEQRRAERLLRVQVQKLEWSNRELQDFAYIASHDLQEPLRAIQAFGERLDKRAGDGLPEDARESLGRMLRAAARMRALIHDLLEFSRVATKGRPFAPVDLGEAARQARGDLARRIEETGGTVDAGPLPTIEADATQMRRLLQNLMDNALKYGREGVPPTVTVRGEVVPGEIVRDEAGEGDVVLAGAGPGRAVCRIEVRDNGIGFEQKYAERIFAPFQRLNGRGRYDGTGVGLAICRKIVERHGGSVSARSEPGAGSLFTVLLPVSHDGEELDPEEAP